MKWDWPAGTGWPGFGFEFSQCFKCPTGWRGLFPAVIFQPPPEGFDSRASRVVLAVSRHHPDHGVGRAPR